jgi:hypothetical protein
MVATIGVATVLAASAAALLLLYAGADRPAPNLGVQLGFMRNVRAWALWAGFAALIGAYSMALLA